MARMIKSTYDIITQVKLSTCFEDGTQKDRLFKVGDIVENLRFVEDGDIRIVSGKIRSINYTVDKITWNPAAPSDTLSKDMKLVKLVIDASAQYESKIVNVPIIEIVEFEDETNVKRMKFAPVVSCDMTLKYSDYTVQNASIEVGDVFDHMKIFVPDHPGEDITGKFEVLGFAYKLDNKALVITGLGLKNVDTNETLVISFKQIFALNEVYDYEIDDADAIAEVIANLADGDSITIAGAVDTSDGKALNITKKDVSIELATDLVCDGAFNSGLRLNGDASVTLTGPGKIVNNTKYDSGHSSGVVGIYGNGELTINGGGIDAVIEEDTVNNGQFGICAFNNAKVTINDGDFIAGWYCVSGNGSGTTADAVTTINGGFFRSTTDYAIYHPHAGKLVINDGNIAGAAGAIAANNGVIEINGGEFAVLGGGDTGEGGDGTAGLTNVALNLNARYGDIVCRITGGTFHATAAGTIMIKTGTAHNVDLKISGGKFTSKPEDAWIAEGYICTAEPDAEGFYEVVKALQ